MITSFYIILCWQQWVKIWGSNHFVLYLDCDFPCVLLFLNYQLKSYPEIYEGYVPMAYGDYLEKMSKYFSAPFVNLKLNIWIKLDYAFAVISMKIGPESGVIMSLCRLQQIWYVLLPLFVIMYLFNNAYPDLPPFIVCMKSPFICFVCLLLWYSPGSS